MTGPCTFEERETEALRVAESALKEAAGLYAVMAAGPESIVMLHLFKRAGGGKVTVPVLFIQQPGLPAGRLKFMDKLRRLWRLDISVVRLPERQGGGDEKVYGLASAALDAVSRAGGAGAVLPWAGGRAAVTGPGIDVYMPLTVFTGDDVGRYITTHRLPRPSDVTPEPAVSGVHPDADGEAVREKLRELGYM